ncbi:MAG TPA: hypothetical protein VE690_03710 [Rhodopila sp.]|nr:hypothetical protein [Rhodopila sp.]
MKTDDIRSGFLRQMAAIAEAHRPSEARFFSRLAKAPARVATSPELLGDIHLVYQGAMHATRAAVYHLPHLDTPALRQRKLRIFIDDDGLPNGDTHHYQLTRVFRNIGARLKLDDEEFGSVDELCPKVDPRLAHFMRQVQLLYPRSHGAWCIVEMLSVEWMGALADALAAHFPTVREEAYFSECFDNKVEERHAEEALSIAADTLCLRRGLAEQTFSDAQTMACALDDVWQLLDDIVVKFAAGIDANSTCARAVAHEDGQG